MNKIMNLIIKYKELIIYFVFGVCTTVVNLIVFKISNVIIGEEYYLISNIIAWFISVIFAYITNKIFVFESKVWRKKVVFKELTSFFSSRVLTFFIEEGGLWLLVDVCKFDDISIDVFSITIGGKMIAKVIVGVIVVVLNYIFSKMFIFKKKK